MEISEGYLYDWALDWQMNVVNKDSLKHEMIKQILHSDETPEDIVRFLKARKWYVKSMEEVFGNET